jgi:drug/metabolite transporter (DMT)-like permease
MTLTPRLALLLTLPPLMWAGNAIVGRMMVGQVPPMTLNLIRWVIAALVLLPFAWRALRPWSRITQRWPYLLMLGTLSVGAYNALQYLALATSPPINVTLVACSLQVWMLLVGMIFFGVRPRARELAGAALGLAGVATVISGGSPAALLQVRFVPGDLYILAAVIGWAVYSWMLARPPAHMRGSERPDWDWAGLLLVQIFFGLLGCGVAAGIEQAAGAAPIPWSWTIVAVLAYVSLGASIVAYRSWGIGVAQGGPGLAALFNNLTPLFAALMSALLLDEMPQLHHLMAFVLIVSGIALSLQPPGRPPQTGRA